MMEGDLVDGREFNRGTEILSPHIRKGHIGNLAAQAREQSLIAFFMNRSGKEFCAHVRSAVSCLFGTGYDCS